MVNSELTGVPTAPTAAAGTNTTQIATTAFVKTAVDTSVANVIDSAPGALDTLNELAAALGDDENFASSMTTALAGKQDNIADGDLTIAKTAGLQTALDSKQATISDGDLTIAKTAGLQAALDDASTSVIKPMLTIPELSSGNILLNFSEGIKDVATYDKDDFSVTTEGDTNEISSVLVENDKLKLKMNYAGTLGTYLGTFNNTTWNIGSLNSRGNNVHATNHQSTRLDHPTAWFDNNGLDLWIWNWKSNRIYKLSNYKESFNLSGETGIGLSEMTLHATNAPNVTAIDHILEADDTYVYYLDNNVLYKYDYRTGGSSAIFIAGQLNSTYGEYVDGIGGNAKFGDPRHKVILDGNIVYVIGNTVLRKCDINTGEVTTLAGNPSSTDTTIFHAGTIIKKGEILTNGGRVLAVTSLADDDKKALENSYQLLNKISFEGMYFRKDIGFDL